MTHNIGGILPVKPLSALVAEEQARAQAQDQANQPVVSELVSLLQRHWTLARQAKEPVERQMIDALRAKRGEYAPDKLASIREQGGSEIYMLLFATKARQAKALIADVLLSTGSDKPWSLSPSPTPELPPDVVSQIMRGVAELVAQAEMSPFPMSTDDVRQLLEDAKQSAEHAIEQEARLRAERAERKVESLLDAGGFIEAVDQFLDDLMVFPTAFLKGPVVRRRPRLTWQQGQDGRFTPQVTTEPQPCWERVDPFMMYPAPWARSVHDAFLFERHRLSRTALTELIGVEGYSETEIRAVLDKFGTGGLRQWLSIDTERASAEGREMGSVMQDDLIDALQYWGSVSGKMLREWGMSEADVPDEAREYEAELWLIDTHVIRAVLNPNPMGKRMYYADSYDRVPGAFWGTSQYALMADCQDMCNAAARALANNMGLASGPQVWVNTERLAPGENLTQMFPWKLWQTTSDPMGSTAPPMGFFQPGSNAPELLAVYERFSMLADEVTGIPRYMAGLGGGDGGAGRTASGMSMMIGNAGKSIKKVVMSLDMHLFSPCVEDAVHYVMRYIGDPDLQGDLRIEARGAVSLVAKEAAQVRRNEFLASTANPFDLQIMGLDGRAELLRDAAKQLDLNPDKVVPSASVLRLRNAQQQMAALQAQQAQAQQPAQKPGQRLSNGAPVTDVFEPKPN